MQCTLFTSLSIHKNPIWEEFLEKISILPKMKLVIGQAGTATWPLTPKPASSHRLHCLTAEPHILSTTTLNRARWKQDHQQNSSEREENAKEIQGSSEDIHYLVKICGLVIICTFPLTLILGYIGHNRQPCNENPASLKLFLWTWAWIRLLPMSQLPNDIVHVNTLPRATNAFDTDQKPAMQGLCELHWDSLLEKPRIPVSGRSIISTEQQMKSQWEHSSKGPCALTSC